MSRRTPWGMLALLALWPVGCASLDAGPEPSDLAERPGESAAGPTRAEREAERAAERAAGPTEAAPPSGAPAVPSAPPPILLTIAAVDALAIPEAEDGRGAVVAASAPAHLDLTRAAGWPGRALDPHLVIGELVFRAYTHVGAETLRFTIADVGALPSDAPAFVQWGQDEASRMPVVTAAATAPTEVAP